MSTALADQVAARLGTSVTNDGFDLVTIDVPSADWVAALCTARDAGFDFFDWLSAVDDGDGTFQVCCHLWAHVERAGLLVRVRIGGADGEPELPTATGVFDGAAWHERETHEMFGVGFTGHAGLEPLLLPPGFEGHPLRKDFALSSRVAARWPGRKDPGESDADLEAGAAAESAGGRRRKRLTPPGAVEVEGRR